MKVTRGAMLQIDFRDAPRRERVGQNEERLKALGCLGGERDNWIVRTRLNARLSLQGISGSAAEQL